MEDKQNNYIDYLKRLVTDFQKNNSMPLDNDDLGSILELIGLEISSEINNGNNLHIPLIAIISNAVTSAVKVDSYNSSRIDDLKDLKKLIKYRSIIKKSPLLSKMVKDKNVNLDVIEDNIPSVNCLIEDDSLLVYSSTKDGEKPIYEIRKGDQFASIYKEDIISVKEAKNVVESVVK